MWSPCGTSPGEGRHEVAVNALVNAESMDRGVDIGAGVIGCVALLATKYMTAVVGTPRSRLYDPQSGRNDVMRTYRGRPLKL